MLAPSLAQLVAQHLPKLLAQRSGLHASLVRPGLLRQPSLPMTKAKATLLCVVRARPAR